MILVYWNYRLISRDYHWHQNWGNMDMSWLKYLLIKSMHMLILLLSWCRYIHTVQVLGIEKCSRNLLLKGGRSVFCSHWWYWLVWNYRLINRDYHWHQNWGNWCIVVYICDSWAFRYERTFQMFLLVWQLTVFVFLVPIGNCAGLWCTNALKMKYELINRYCVNVSTVL